MHRRHGHLTKGVSPCACKGPVSFFGRALAAAGLALAVAGGAAGARPPFTPEELAFFEAKVRPALVEHCYGCHSREKGKAKGGLELDTRSRVLRGGDSGPAVVPGKPDDSLLVKAIRYTDPDRSMPPKNKLPA